MNRDNPQRNGKAREKKVIDQLDRSLSSDY
jgi:hypothetical protein